MKPIQLAPQHRQDIDRRREASHERRLYERLTAVLAIAAGKTREAVAEFLGVSHAQPGDWLRVFRDQGLDALCALRNRGDPGHLSAQQVEQLKQEIGTGRFRNSDQIRHRIAGTFSVSYASSGVKQLPQRVGASYHRVTGLLWKADPDQQHEFVTRYEQQKAASQRPGTRCTRRHFVDACHPLRGLELVYACRPLVGQRFLAGMGGGRKRPNVQGAYCPDDQEHLDLRLTRGNINGEQFVNLPRLLRATHPEAERLVPYLGRARYYGSPVVKDRLRRHPGFELEPSPTYSPNPNPIERPWKFVRKEALSRWHPSFEAMREAVSGVLDHVGKYRPELEALLVEAFHIVEKREVPAEYRGAA